jgi:hypothetical protein
VCIHFVLCYVTCVAFCKLYLLNALMSVCRDALVRNAGTEAVQQSVRQGVGLKVKKSDVLTREEEQLMLKSDGASLDHPKGLNNRFVYFCCKNFFIRG